jgi:hypothetical protein
VIAWNPLPKTGARIVGLGVVVVLVWIAMSRGGHPSEEVPGMWATTDMSRPESIEWPANWHGDRCISCQWLHRYLVDRTWKLGEGAAQGEDIFASYFWWGTAKPPPEGTKILIEGDFPSARYFNGLPRTRRGGSDPGQGAPHPSHHAGW